MPLLTCPIMHGRSGLRATDYGAGPAVVAGRGNPLGRNEPSWRDHMH